MALALKRRSHVIWFGLLVGRLSLLVIIKEDTRMCPCTCIYVSPIFLNKGPISFLDYILFHFFFFINDPLNASPEVLFLFLSSGMRD